MRARQREDSLVSAPIAEPEEDMDDIPDGIAIKGRRKKKKGTKGKAKTNQPVARVKGKGGSHLICPRCKVSFATAFMLS
ncbi:hypothetical protein KIPB_014611, partial [Kipferlia bialata]|eukprot:g14611.t1